jgi:hypothetical protein
LFNHVFVESVAQCGGGSLLANDSVAQCGGGNVRILLTAEIQTQQTRHLDFFTDQRGLVYDVRRARIVSDNATKFAAAIAAKRMAGSV